MDIYSRIIYIHTSKYDVFTHYLLCIGNSTHDSSITEGCIRVRALYKGGMWVIARKTLQRTVYLGLERCTTLTDAHDILSQTTSGVLSNVLI